MSKGWQLADALAWCEAVMRQYTRLSTAWTALTAAIDRYEAAPEPAPEGPQGMVVGYITNPVTAERLRTVMTEAHLAVVGMNLLCDVLQDLGAVDLLGELDHTRARHVRNAHEHNDERQLYVNEYDMWHRSTGGMPDELNIGGFNAHAFVETIRNLVYPALRGDPTS